MAPAIDPEGMSKAEPISLKSGPTMGFRAKPQAAIKAMKTASNVVILFNIVDNIINIVLKINYFKIL